METTQPINEQSGEQTASQPQVQPTVEPIISVRNIRKTFDRLEVLKGIDLDIMPHEVVSIVGPSGSPAKPPCCKSWAPSISPTADPADSRSASPKFVGQ